MGGDGSSGFGKPHSVPCGEFLLCLNVLISHSGKRLTLINVARVRLSCSESSLCKESFVKSSLGMESQKRLLKN